MARKGADHRYRELKAEIASLVKNFPHLGKSREKGGAWGEQVPGAPAEVPSPRAPRKRRKMSAAARKKISDAQKARWAKQKGK
jgi:hypothetical protein